MDYSAAFDNTELIDKCRTGDKASKKEFADAVAEYTFTFPIRIKCKIPVFSLEHSIQFTQYYNGKCRSTEYSPEIESVEDDEFYLELLEKIRSCQVFSTYNPEYKFKQYYDRILFNTYCSLYKKQKSVNKKIEMDNREFEDITDKNLVENFVDTTEKSGADVLKNILKLFDVKDRTALKIIYIKYFSFATDELKHLAEINNTKILNICDKLADLEKNNMCNNKETTPVKIAAEILNTTEEALNTRLSRLRQKIKLMIEKCDA